MSRQPTVSVIVPCYNGSKYLEETLDSIVDQSYEDWECIIVDDGSTDSSPTIAKGYCERDTRVSLIRKTNGGLASARNAGVNASRGKLIAFLDADDRWHQNKLLHHVEHLNRNLNIAVSYSWTKFIDENGKVLTHCRKPKTNRLSQYYLFCRNPVTNGSNGVFRKECLLVNRFDEELSHNQDVDCWLRISFGSTKPSLFEGLPIFLTYYRINRKGLSNNFHDHYACAKRVWDKASQYCPEITLRYRKTAEAFQLRFYSRRAISDGHYEQARHLIWQALNLDASITVREPVSTFATLFAAYIPRCLRFY